MRRCASGLLVLVVALGCGGRKQPEPADQLWSEAQTAYQDEAYELAVERYKALLDQHPFDPNAEQAELRIALSHFMAARYPEAIAAFGDFERMHPTSADLPMVEYHMGLAYLAQASTPDRDQLSYANALTAFRNLIDRFPTTSWADKARLRVRECREALSSHEAGISRYYLRQGNLVAAEARLRGLLAEYAETDATAEMLDRFATAYDARDEQDGARLALATLVVHHPDGPLARSARERLGPALDSFGGQDPLQLLIAHLDQMKQQADRQQVPRTVSAFPDAPAGGAPRY